MPRTVDVDALEKILREFLGTRGQNFLITRDSLGIFAGAALHQLRSGTDPNKLALWTKKARMRALSSAASAGSRVTHAGSALPLLREKEGGQATSDCGSFEPL